MKYAIRIWDCRPIMGQKPRPGSFVKEYDPWAFDGGGVCDITDDPDDALLFDSVADAVAFYRQEAGVRADGKPNRPLTAASVEIAPVKL